MSATADYRRHTGDKPARIVVAACTRCAGAGGHRMWPNWTCFRCGGSGGDPTRRLWAFPVDWTDDQCGEFLARKEAARLRAQERRQAKRMAEWEAGRAEREAAEAARLEEIARHEAECWQTNVAACPALAIYSDHPTPAIFPGFCHDVAEQARYRVLSPRQIEVFERLVRKAAK